MGGLETPGGATTSLTEIGQGRKMVVDISLKRAGDSVTGQSNVDPKGYLTDLGHIKISTDAEIGDIKRARTLLKSVVNTNPNNAPGWVAAARLVRAWSWAVSLFHHLILAISVRCCLPAKHCITTSLNTIAINRYYSRYGQYLSAQCHSVAIHQIINLKPSA